MTKQTGQNYTPQQHIFLNIPNTNKHTIKLTITIIQNILFEIWHSRNNNEYDKKLIPQHTIINKINTHLKTTHFKEHKLNNTLQTFQDQFCINEAIAILQNNLLAILL